MAAINPKSSVPLTPLDEKTDSRITPRPPPVPRQEAPGRPFGGEEELPAPRPRAVPSERLELERPFRSPRRRPRYQKLLISLVVAASAAGIWVVSFRSYLRPLSAKPTARLDDTRKMELPVYEVPSRGPSCLVELKSDPVGSEVRLNRVWFGGMTPTMLSLPCRQTTLLTLTTRKGSVSHQLLSPVRPLETLELRVSKSPVFRAATWWWLLIDFHSRFFGSL
jgi:hypothetical protein